MFMMADPAQAAPVCGVIITYNPGADLLGNVLLLKQQAGGVVVVDNGSSGAARQRLDEVESQTGCTVIRNGKNLGIAAALNIGMRCALDKQFEWVVTFDQDSTITDGFIDALLDVARSSTDAGIVCPVYRDRLTGTAVSLPKLHSGDLITTMTSGSMLHRSVFLKAGRFDERLYIDSVDTEYSLRLRSMGLRLIQTERAVLLHSLGRLTFHRFLGKTLATTNHSAARRYYMVRNRLFVLRRYPQDWAWVRCDIEQTLKEIVVILLVESQKAAKLRLMFQGAMDCVRGKWGPRVPL